MSSTSSLPLTTSPSATSIFPPLIAAVGWLVDRLAPNSLVALRIVSLAAGRGR